MKALNRKSLVVLVLSFIFALSMVAFAGVVKPAKADGELITVTTADFQILDEASVRIKGTAEKPGSGIRFRAKVSDSLKTALDDETTDVAKMGFIITPKYYFDNRAGDEYLDTTLGIAKYVKIEVAEETFYPAEDGSWYVNGALNNINANNINLEFTAIAYVFDGSTYHYSAPGADFSRTYTEVIQKAFIDGYDASLLKEAAHMADDAESETPGFISQMQSGAVTVAIETAEDLYNLSDSVANNKTFENAKFEITNDLVVDYDFAPIDSGVFAGSITASEEGKTVQVYNNSGLGNSIFSDGETVSNLTVNNDKNFFDFSAKSGELVSYLKFGTTFHGTMVDDVANLENVGNYIKYGDEAGEDAVKVEITSNDSQVALRANYTLDQLDSYVADYTNANPLEEGQQVGVKIHYLCTNGVGRNNTATNVMSAIGYTATDAIADVTSRNWLYHVISLEDFKGCYIDGNDDGVLDHVYLIRTYGEFDFYIGKIELVNWNFENNIELNYTYDFDVNEQDFSRVTVKANTTATLESKDNMPTEIIAGEKTISVLNNIGYDKDFVKVVTASSTQGIRVKMNYTGEEYKKIAAQEGFETVKFSYFIASEEGITTDANALLGASVGGNRAGVWTTVVVSIDTFVGAFGSFDGTSFVADPTSKYVAMRQNAWNSPYTILFSDIKLVDDDSFEANYTYWSNTVDIDATEENTNAIHIGSSTKTYPTVIDFEEVPTQLVYTDATTSEEKTIDITNTVGASGKVFKFTGVANHNKFIYLNFKQSLYGIKALGKEQGYDSIRFFMMIEIDPGYPTSNRYAGALVGLAGASKLGSNAWVECIVPLDNIDTARTSGNMIEVYSTQQWTSSKRKACNIYFTSFELYDTTTAQ